jgi:hypothetical protein
MDTETYTIYMISCLLDGIDMFYIGRTKDLKRRMYSHKSEYKTCQHRPLYKAIVDSGGWDNWEFIILESGPCITSNTANNRECFFQRKCEPMLNMKPIFIFEDDDFSDWKIFASKWGEPIVNIHTMHLYEK